MLEQYISKGMGGSDVDFAVSSLATHMINFALMFLLSHSLKLLLRGGKKKTLAKLQDMLCFAEELSSLGNNVGLSCNFSCTN